MIISPDGLLFRVMTYNVLADAFVKPEFFPNTEAACLHRNRRYPLIIERVRAAKADLVCLQEVDRELWEGLSSSLQCDGYVGSWSPRHDTKPDGCALLWRERHFETRLHHLRFDELAGEKPARRAAIIAQIFVIDHEEVRPFSVFNAHFAWEADGTLDERHHGLFEAGQLLGWRGPDEPLIIAGDFNAEPGHVLLQLMRRHDLRDSHAEDELTKVEGGRAHKSDYLLGTHHIEARPVPMTTLLKNDTPLPSVDEPSDHLPVITDFFLKR